VWSQISTTRATSCVHVLKLQLENVRYGSHRTCMRCALAVASQIPKAESPSVLAHHHLLPPPAGAGFFPTSLPSAGIGSGLTPLIPAPGSRRKAGPPRTSPHWPMPLEGMQARTEIATREIPPRAFLHWKHKTPGRR
jgi:hypothetical protein